MAILAALIIAFSILIAAGIIARSNHRRNGALGRFLDWTRGNDPQSRALEASLKASTDELEATVKKEKRNG